MIELGKLYNFPKDSLSLNVELQQNSYPKYVLSFAYDGNKGRTVGIDIWVCFMNTHYKYT
jgi:hypothetical protein